MDKKIVYLDMDDTITELLVPWVNWLNTKYGLNVKAEEINDWNLEHTFTTLTHDEIFEPLIHGGKEFWSKIKPVIDAQFYVKKLQEKYNVYIVTSTNYQNIFYKMEYVIHRLFPSIPDNNVIFTHNKTLLNGFVMVDDHCRNLDGGNYHKILINKPYNQDATGDYIRVDSWEEIWYYINKLDS